MGWNPLGIGSQCWWAVTLNQLLQIPFPGSAWLTSLSGSDLGMHGETMKLAALSQAKISFFTCSFLWFSSLSSVYPPMAFYFCSLVAICLSCCWPHSSAPGPWLSPVPLAPLGCGWCLWRVPVAAWFAGRCRWLNGCCLCLWFGNWASHTLFYPESAVGWQRGLVEHIQLKSCVSCKPGTAHGLHTIIWMEFILRLQISLCWALPG